MNKFEKLLGTEYKFLDEDERLGNNIHLLTYGGSRAYGTNLPTSDVDIRGIATNTPQAILTREDFEIYTDENTDTVIYSLDKILTLLSNCNPNTIEILFVRDEDIIYVDEIGQMLIDNRDIFLSNRCIGTFGGYANQQLYRLQQKTLSALTQEEYEEHIAKVIQNMRVHLNNSYSTNCVDIISTKDGLKAIITEDEIPVENLYGIMNEISNVIKEYNKNSKRNKKAMEHGKINKHAMHLLRLYFMAIELITTGTVCTYRTKEHDLLMDIRNGKYSTKDGNMSVEFFDMVKEAEQKFNEAKTNSVLPDSPNMTKIKELQTKINKKVIV